jgi:hypothetical protein
LRHGLAGIALAHERGGAGGDRRRREGMAVRLKPGDAKKSVPSATSRVW